MRSIISIILIVIAVVVGYNYFLGNPEEKSESQEIVDQVKDLGRSIGDLIKSEKEKLENGKYDGFFDKLEGIFKKLESQISSTDTAKKEEFRELEKDKLKVEKEIQDAEGKGLTDEKLDELEAKLKELLERTEKLLNDSAQ